jgi:phospholipase A1
MKNILLPLITLATCVTGLAARAEKAADLPQSALEARLDSTNSRRPKWFIEPHRPNYVLPVSYIPNPSEQIQQAAEAAGNTNQFQDVEVKFQISLRLAVAEDLIADNGDLYFAYTQVSVWQAYNRDASSPFRDTNYEPELFLSFDTDYDILGLKGRLLTVGAVHQSNGRGNEDLSRSWNRIYANIVLERGNFVCALKPWWRIPEPEDEDNNPDIAKYYGYGEFRAAYKFREHVFATMLRNNLRLDGNKGAVELDWSFPLAGQVKGFVQYFYGYGETLLDYNELDQRFGVGFLLADWL